MSDKYIFPEDCSLPERYALTAIAREVDLPYGSAFARGELPEEIAKQIPPGAPQPLIWVIDSIPGFDTPQEWLAEAHGSDIDGKLSAEGFRNLEAQMRIPERETLPGISMDLNEIQTASTLIHYVSGYHRRPGNPYEIAEIVVRNAETGDLVGSVMRTDDGSVVYNKDER